VCISYELTKINFPYWSPECWQRCKADTYCDMLQPRLCYRTYRTNFRRCRSNRLGVGGGPEKFGTMGPRPLETEAWMNP